MRNARVNQAPSERHFRRSGHIGRMAGRFRAAFTLIELIIVVAVISILALIAIPSLLTYQTRAKVAASKNNQSVLANAIEMYRLDFGAFPTPLNSPDDPFGLISRRALARLTTPTAYVGPAAFRDPFGTLRVQMPLVSPFGRALYDADPFRPPTPGFNLEQSLLYFHYDYLAPILSDPVPLGGAFAVVSVGPDLKDSFIMYYPFPRSLPGRAGLFGIQSVADTVYDPTNGTVSGGDLATFGGSLPVPRQIGGGN